MHSSFEISNFEFRIANFPPTNPYFQERRKAVIKFEIRNQ